MSLLNVNKIAPQSGTDFTLGDSGDTFTVPSGATLTVAGTFTQTGAQTFDGGVDIRYDDKTIDVKGKQHKGHAICKPTTYVKGGNSYTCLYYKEIGKTTFNK